MKKLLTAVVSLSLLGAIALPALAADSELPMDISSGPELAAPASETGTGFAIEVDGEQIDARVCVTVPLRAVAEKMGFAVTWNGDGTITVTGDERYAELTLGVNRYFAAPTQEGMMGTSLFSLSCAPYSIDGKTYVPVELFDALLGCKEGTVTLEGNTVKINTNPSAEETVQIPSPFTDHATLADAAKAVGFELAAPETVNGNSRRGIQTIDGEMIQAFYGDKDREVCIRKAPGTEDISGDFNQYAERSTETVGDVEVTMKGSDGQVCLATWTKDGYTYSIVVYTGISGDDMVELVAGVR